MTIFDTAKDTGHKPTNEELYFKQMALLKTFRDRNAISQEQYNTSSRDLAQKMGLHLTGTH